MKHLVSYLTHPLLVLSYMLLLMLAVNPYAFGANELTDKRGMLLLISVFTTSCFIPGVGVALMKPLGLIKSLEMRDKQDRIGPFIVTGVFYLWLFKNFKEGVVPLIYARFALGATIGLFVAFFITIFNKISIHAVGMGALLTMTFLLAQEWPGKGLHIGPAQISLNVVLALVMLLAGYVGYSRLASGEHKPAEVWSGYAAGCVSVLLGYWIL